VKLYRITKERYLTDLSGQGGSYRDGGRWNKAGQPVLYFGSSAAVVMLEMGNYLPNPRLVPKDMVIGIYEVDTTAVKSVELSDLPENWDHFPYPACTQTLGADFLDTAHNLVLQVPSCASGGLDQIAVVNPLHPEAKNIQLVKTITQIYNPRLFQGMK
tara:strand:+ start:14616 stop:15089 length:474 start_codon:yes stop_codon:yes gene_type:complete